MGTGDSLKVRRLASRPLAVCIGDFFLEGGKGGRIGNLCIAVKKDIMKKRGLWEIKSGFVL